MNGRMRVAMNRKLVTLGNDSPHYIWVPFGHSPQTEERSFRSIPGERLQQAVNRSWGETGVFALSLPIDRDVEDRAMNPPCPVQAAGRRFVSSAYSQD